MKYQVYCSPASLKWYFRVVGENGEVMVPSEPYATKYNAKRALRRLFGNDINIEELD